MDKCKHGFSECSECHQDDTDPEVKRSEWEESISFNNKCADIMGFRPNWRHDTALWVDGNKEIQQAMYSPYFNIDQLANVVDMIIHKSTKEPDLDELVAGIINTSVLLAFRVFVLAYNEKT